MWALLAACWEPTVDYNALQEVSYMFLNIKRNIHAPYTHIVALWHISNLPSMIW